MNAEEPTPPRPDGDQEKDWIYRDSTKRLLWAILGTACFLSIFAELFLTRHAHFEIDESLGFFALLGFGMCAIMIFAAKGLGYILKKSPDFYDRRDDADAVAQEETKSGEGEDAP